ncbi:MAG: radical SAM family heme chaperone HemW [Desulfofustis sp. PB-SRB1]|jgi:oxygen-independent coproporphyrinogen-3 oxidase|nr:radical SAM family heme chaperone HemW [Desulfofustis sp. PB-SRB1]MBM1003648.1 radical SAM family heme chaperone HemW [Desulfofustis sp. PB-SRB1]HBH28793.1 coproporphyrinogen III oxidase family protein [Desulfofustis sp.]HBH31031.1 coproporphyrinogen III oxidase family protein [Desulfofustis sp.]
MVRALYIHLPFCLKKCLYCGFPSTDDPFFSHERYIQALVREISGVRDLGETDSLTSVYMGGGTPSALAPSLLADLLVHCRTTFRMEADAEITIEVNPATVSNADLELLRGTGFNRLSVGVQSIHNDELASLGRLHDGAAGLRCIAMAASAGFTNISVDLMYGIPRQTPDSWRQTLEAVLAGQPTHLSIYELSIEPDTPFGVMQAAGELATCSEDDLTEMEEITSRVCTAARLHRYEIASYARAGNLCRHNLTYWRNLPYYGCGAGSVSFINGSRCRRVSDPEGYCRSLETGQPVFAECEKLSAEAGFKESVMLGLRLMDGPDISELQQRYQLDIDTVYPDEITTLVDQGLLHRTSRRVYLTPRGLRYANMVMARLI